MGIKTKSNIQFIIIVLSKDPVVVCFQAQLLLGSIQTHKDAQTALTVLHHFDLLLDSCKAGESQPEN